MEDTTIANAQNVYHRLTAHDLAVCDYVGYLRDLLNSYSRTGFVCTERCTCHPDRVAPLIILDVRASLRLIEAREI